MQPTITIDASKWNAQVLALSVALGKDGPEVMKDEARLLIKQVIGFTPPRNKKHGENAIERDINRAVKPLNDAYFESDALKELARTKTPDQMQAILRGMKGWERWEVKPFEKRLHNSKKDRRGRVQGRWRVFAHAADEVLAYIAKIKGHAGRLRAGWLPSYRMLGGKLPAWVARHASGARGYGTMSLNPQKPVITIENHALGVREVEAKVRQALRARISAMARRVKLILSGYLADMARGIRAQSRARRTAGSDVAN